MKKLYIFTFLFLVITSQLPAAGGEEYYFRFRPESPSDLAHLTRMISIDNFDGTLAHAYANEEQMAAFRALGLEFEMLPHPGTLIDPEMSTSLTRMREWDTYPTYEVYVEMMYAFATDYPDLCEVISIGTTVEGRELIYARISDNVHLEEDEPEFIYISSIHGDETTGYILLLRLIDYLLTNYQVIDQATELVDNLEIWINPLANPDGTYHSGNHTVYGARRQNANGVDLNRNFIDPEDGEHPDGYPWQPETIAMMEFTGQHSLNMGANLHGGTEVLNYPWDTWQRRHADDLWFQQVCHTYADTAQAYSPNGYMNGYDDGITNGYDWYSISGGHQDYVNYFADCREITLEISDIKLLPPDQLPALWEYNYRSLLNYMAETLKGIHGLVTNPDGNPVLAQLFIPDHDIDNSEMLTDPQMGDYHRLLKNGIYDLLYTAYAFSGQTFYNIQLPIDGYVRLDVSLLPDPYAVNLTGLVLDSQSGEVIPNALISVLNRPVAPVHSADDGSYSLYLMSETIQFEVTAEGYETGSFQLDIDESNPDFDFQLDIGPFPAVSPAYFNKIIPVNSTDVDTLVLSNVGGGILDFTIYASELPERDVTGSYLSCDTGSFTPGETVDWLFTIYNLSPDGEWLRELIIDFPAGVWVNTATDFSGGSGGDFIYDGNTGDEISLTWLGETSLGYGVLHEGETASGSVNVTISETVNNDITLNYQLSGDHYGSEPHVINGSLKFTNPLSWIALDCHSGSLPAGNQQEILITFNTEDMLPGDYACNLIICQNSIPVLTVPVNLTVTTTAAEQQLIPEPSALLGNYPNPFNPSTCIYYQIAPGCQQASLKIFNLKGQLVREFNLLEEVPAEAGRIEWNGTDGGNRPVASGLYFYQLFTDNASFQKKMLLLK